MDAYRAQVVADWLLALRGSATQDVFLADLKREIGWAPHRPNLSKYENGRAIPEAETLAHFVAYAAKRGIAGPDFTPPAPMPSIEERTVAALEAQAKATKALADELRLWRTKDRDRLDQLEAWMDQVIGAAPGAPDTQGAGAPPAPPETAG